MKYNCKQTVDIFVNNNGNKKIYITWGGLSMYSVGAMNSMVADLHSGLRLGSPYDFETGSYKNSSGTENKSFFFQKI